MKNLTPFNGNCFDVHKEAVEQKNIGDLKTRLLALNPSIEIEFQEFLAKFSANQLSSLLPNHALSLSKADLLTLYSYQSSVIVSFRANIRRLQVKTIISTCQNCSIDTANTLDHILPQAKYPEFVVNPKNLFPCCSTCNSYKLASTGAQKFLNLYLDVLPKEQYLFVNVSLDNTGDLDFEYFLQNVNGKIDAALFSTIENHYTQLRLFTRFKVKSIEYISELETKVNGFLKHLPIEVIIANLIDVAETDKKAYGDNHWRCILEISLLKSPLFLAKF